MAFCIQPHQALANVCGMYNFVHPIDTSAALKRLNNQALPCGILVEPPNLPMDFRGITCLYLFARSETHSKLWHLVYNPQQRAWTIFDPQKKIKAEGGCNLRESVEKIMSCRQLLKSLPPSAERSLEQCGLTHLFHSSMTREQAEKTLTSPGQWLIRKSSQPNTEHHEFVAISHRLSTDQCHHYVAAFSKGKEDWYETPEARYSTLRLFIQKGLDLCLKNGFSRVESSPPDNNLHNVLKHSR